MASTENIATTPAAEPQIDVTINTKPEPANADKKDVDCTCEASMPRLARRDSIESIISIDADFRRPVHRGARPNYVRRYSPSPIRIRPAPAVVTRDLTAVLPSSTHLLDKVGKYDGIADLPFPARCSIYLSTYPFADKDVKKWSWLFSLNIEDTFLAESRRGRTGDVDTDGEDAGYRSVHPVRPRRDRSPFYDPGTVDLPSVYLSRALDTDVVPEDTENVKYLIVTQNRHRPAGSKLLVAESRNAAGIIMYYELLKGDSIMFVGAAVGLGKKTVHPKKFKKVQSLEEAGKVLEEGLVGVVC